MQQIMTSQTANGASTTLPATALADRALKTIFVWGTFDGASVKVEVSANGIDWVDATNDSGAVLTFTAKGVSNINVHGAHIRFNVSSAGASTSLNGAIA